ncbi:MAG: pyridine nucleotide-disulfide oxidoreductase, partial [Deltaproteobacteria bacterium]|nr:pyridine nucleotide-disulfide oxidoreductase [Deltaproteobacteria bacterium]
PSSGKVLGSQIIGEKGVDKRIDVIATAIRGGMTVYDLEELEPAYAPPYSSAKDPVNIAGYVSVNMLQGDMATINWDEIGDFNVKDNVFIDVRNKKELEEAGLIPGALHIPLPELRSKLSQFDKDKNYIIFCAVGLRSYLAQRIFTQNGFTCISVCGGYRTYLGARSKIMKESPASCIWLGGE